MTRPHDLEFCREVRDDPAGIEAAIAKFCRYSERDATGKWQVKGSSNETRDTREETATKESLD